MATRGWVVGAATDARGQSKLPVRSRLKPAPSGQPCRSCRARSGVPIHQEVRFFFFFVLLTDRQNPRYEYCTRQRDGCDTHAQTVVPLTRRMRRERGWRRRSGGVGRGVVWGRASENGATGARVAPRPTLTLNVQAACSHCSRAVPPNSPLTGLFSLPAPLTPSQSRSTCSCDYDYSRPVGW